MMNSRLKDFYQCCVRLAFLCITDLYSNSSHKQNQLELRYKSNTGTEPIPRKWQEVVRVVAALIRALGHAGRLHVGFKAFPTLHARLSTPWVYTPNDCIGRTICT